MNVCMVVNNLVNNGIGKVVLTYSAKLIEHAHAVTVLVGGPTEADKVAEARGLGVEVSILPDKKRETLAYFKALKLRLNAGGFDIVHVHGNSGMVLPELAVAKCSRAMAVACHCHSTGCEHPVLHNLLRPFVPSLCDAMFACSREAGKWLYGSSCFTVLPNSFDLSAFSFDAGARASVRADLGIAEGAYVIGNVARLNPEKNHAFLIEVFERFRRLVPSSVLVIAGGGPGEARVRGLIEASPERDAIQLLGNVADPARLYSAMDCFVFPSIHEGLGIVLVEAQLSGLPCVVSDGIPRGADVSDRFHALPLSAGADAWAEAIHELLDEGPRDAVPPVDSRAAAFDIRRSYRVLEGSYREALDRSVRR